MGPLRNRRHARTSLNNANATSHTTGITVKTTVAVAEVMGIALAFKGTFIQRGRVTSGRGDVSSTTAWGVGIGVSVFFVIHVGVGVVLFCS